MGFADDTTFVVFVLPAEPFSLAAASRASVSKSYRPDNAQQTVMVVGGLPLRFGCWLWWNLHLCLLAFCSLLLGGGLLLRPRATLDTNASRDEVVWACSRFLRRFHCRRCWLGLLAGRSFILGCSRIVKPTVDCGCLWACLTRFGVQLPSLQSSSSVLGTFGRGFFGCWLWWNLHLCLLAFCSLLLGGGLLLKPRTTL